MRQRTAQNLHTAT